MIALLFDRTFNLVTKLEVDAPAWRPFTLLRFDGKVYRHVDSGFDGRQKYQEADVVDVPQQVPA